MFFGWTLSLMWKIQPHCSRVICHIISTLWLAEGKKYKFMTIMMDLKYLQNHEQSTLAENTKGSWFKVLDAVVIQISTTMRITRNFLVKICFPEHVHSLFKPTLFGCIAVLRKWRCLFHWCCFLPTPYKQQEYYSHQKGCVKVISTELLNL